MMLRAFQWAAAVADCLDGQERLFPGDPTKIKHFNIYSVNMQGVNPQSVNGNALPPTRSVNRTFCRDAPLLADESKRIAGQHRLEDIFFTSE